MILADTSAWIEYLRATGTPVHLRVKEILAREEPLAVTDVVVMEVLAGARDDQHRERLRRLLYRFELLSVRGLGDYESAADLYRTCRRAGETVRKLTDCLIAAVAIRHDASVLHRDADFEVLARHTPLSVEATTPSRPMSSE